MSAFHLKRFPKVIFGEGAYKELPELIGHFGNKALIITMRDLFEIDLMDPVLDLLKESDIDFKIYKDAKPEPKIENYKEAIDLVRSESFDVIIDQADEAQRKCGDNEKLDVYVIQSSQQQNRNQCSQDDDDPSHGWCPSFFFLSL